MSKRWVDGCLNAEKCILPWLEITFRCPLCRRVSLYVLKRRERKKRMDRARAGVCLVFLIGIYGLGFWGFRHLV